MISKRNHPKITIKERIDVEGHDCIVSQIHHANSVMGACEVVTNSAKPVCRDVCWDGQAWVFSDRPTFVDAMKSSRLKEFVETLQKQG